MSDSRGGGCSEVARCSAARMASGARDERSRLFSTLPLASCQWASAAADSRSRKPMTGIFRRYETLSSVGMLGRRLPVIREYTVSEVRPAASAKALLFPSAIKSTQARKFAVNVLRKEVGVRGGSKQIANCAIVPK